MPIGRWTGLVIILRDLEHLQNGSECSKLRSGNALWFVPSQNPSEKYRVTGMASSLDRTTFPSQSRGVLVCDNLPDAVDERGKERRFLCFSNSTTFCRPSSLLPRPPQPNGATVESAGSCLAVCVLPSVWKEATPCSGEQLSLVASMWTVSGVREI